MWLIAKTTEGVCIEWWENKKCLLSMRSDVSQANELELLLATLKFDNVKPQLNARWLLEQSLGHVAMDGDIDSLTVGELRRAL